MKLIAKNFTGHFKSTGQRYRIGVETTDDTVTAKLQLHVSQLDHWTLEHMGLKNYGEKRTYESALRIVLEEIQEKYGLVLIKTDLQIAI